MMTALAPGTLAALKVALGDPGVIQRYQSKITHLPGHQCTWWTGAVTGRTGHGRFWIGADPNGDVAGFVVIAHRFGYGLAYGLDAVLAAPVLGHQCDNPLCQEPDPQHAWPMTSAQNSADWATRRHTLGGSLRDRRGARQRALAVRTALRTGHGAHEALQAGIPVVERDQLPLW